MKVRFLVRASMAITIGMIIGVSLTNEKTVALTITDNSVVTIASADAIAKELLTSQSYSCLKTLIYKESRGKSDAKNPDSSALGLGQLLDSTYRNLGMKHSNNEGAQLVAMLGYIGRKYGSGGPCAAERFHSRHNFY